MQWVKVLGKFLVSSVLKICSNQLKLLCFVEPQLSRDLLPILFVFDPTTTLVFLGALGISVQAARAIDDILALFLVPLTMLLGLWPSNLTIHVADIWEALSSLGCSKDV